jgi:hypothetical protein
MHPKEHSLFGALVASTPVLCSDVSYSGTVTSLNVTSSQSVDLLCPGFYFNNNFVVSGAEIEQISHLTTPE